MAYEFTKASVKKGWSSINNATEARKVAFALGRIDAVPVVVVLPRGKPSAAQTQLASAKYLKQSDYRPNEAPKKVDLAAVQNKKVTVTSSGLLRWDEPTKILYLQCTKQDTTAAKRFLEFYQQWNLSKCWGEIQFEALPANAEDDPAEDDPGAATVEDAADDPPLAELELPPVVAEPASPPIVEEVASDEIARVAQENVQKAVNFLLLKRQELGMPTVDPDELREQLARIPAGVSYDRLLLQLIHTSNVVDAVAQLDAEPGLRQEDDEATKAKISQAMLALAIRVAEQRGLLPSSVQPNGAQITKLVAGWWKSHAGDPGSRTEGVVNFVTGQLDTKNDAWLAGFLGLPGRAVDRTTASWLELWKGVSTHVASVTQQLKRVVDEQLKAANPLYSVRALNGSWGKVDGTILTLGAAEFNQALRAWASVKAEDTSRKQRLDDLRVTIQVRLSYVTMNPEIGMIDDNPFGIESGIRARLMTVLETIGKALPSD